MVAKKVLVTGAAGQIAYAVVASISKGELFGPDTPIKLVLLDIEIMQQSMEGVRMELDDCAYPLLEEITCTTDVAEAFKDVDVAMLVGAMPRKEGMERSDLLKSNAKIFKTQGEAIEKYASKDIKVMVIGNPANTNAYICSHYAPSVPKKNFSAMTRLDENRAKTQIAKKLGCSAKDISNVVIWGNHSATQVPDPSNALCCGKKVSLETAYIQNEFIRTVATRGAAIIKARKLSSAMSAAKAGVDHVHDWILGNPEGKWVNMAVCSNGEYGVEKGLFYSYPCYCKGGDWQVVTGLQFPEYIAEKMKVTEAELKDEMTTAMAYLAEQ